MSNHVHDFQTTVKESLLRLIFELTGTCLLTTLWLSTTTSGDSIGFFVGFFVLLVFSARISGSHFNPAVTLAFMVRKETGGFSRILGIAYMLFQIAGGLLGGLLGYTFFQAQPSLGLVKTPNDGYLILQSIVIQALATAILVFLYLTQTEEKTKLSDDNAITTLIIAAAYYVGVYWSSSFVKVQTANPLNPAIAMGDGLGMLLHNVLDWNNWFWIFYIVPLGGSLIAVLLFEYVYKPAQETVQEEQPDNLGDGLLANE